MSNNLVKIQECITADALVKDDKYLVEPANKTKQNRTNIKLSTNSQYLLYSFEQIKKPLFPFFNNSNNPPTGLNAIADYVVFTDKHVFVIELKGNKNPESQLWATKQLVKYLINSINRVSKINYEPEIRGLSNSTHPKFRPSTNVGKNPYDSHENAKINQEELILDYYMQ